VTVRVHLHIQVLFRNRLFVSKWVAHIVSSIVFVVVFEITRKLNERWRFVGSARCLGHATAAAAATATAANSSAAVAATTARWETNDRTVLQRCHSPSTAAAT
jgi:hypothetical protein